MFRKNGWNRNPREVRRGKVLSKPMEKGRRPCDWLVGSGKPLKTDAHRLIRRCDNRQSSELIAEVAVDDTLTMEEMMMWVIMALLVSIFNRQSYSIRGRAMACRCVHVNAAGKLFFHKKLKIRRF